MPTYDYRCETCGDFELFQSMKDDALTECPTCGGAVKRLISPNVNIIFKGSGFYATDNRSDNYKKDKEAAASSPASSTSSSSASSSSTSSSSASSSSAGESS